MNTDEPDEVAFFALFDLPENMELFITDRAWNGTHLVDNVENEGTLMVRRCFVPFLSFCLFEVVTSRFY